MRAPIVNHDEVTALAPGAAGHSIDQGKKPVKRKTNGIDGSDLQNKQVCIMKMLYLVNNL